MPTGPEPLPDFTHCSYRIVRLPPTPKGRGWDKLQECERPLAMYQWVQDLNNPHELNIQPPQHEVLLDDCLSAFLMTLEAPFSLLGSI